MSGSASARTPRPSAGGARAAEGGAGIAVGRSTLRVRSQGVAPVSVLPSQRQGTNMADNWPLHNYLELGALPGAVPRARLHTRQLLWEWGFSDVVDDVELLVSELVTNALRVTAVMKQALPIRLWLLSNSTRVVISVWDGNPRPPVRINVGDDAESGRGLVLVGALSDRWDWFAHKELGGKVVWCELSREAVAATPGCDPRTGR
jgi:anti-sigma regulatory factor (Ser/Thr protein kinase)